MSVSRTELRGGPNLTEQYFALLASDPALLTQRTLGLYKVVDQGEYLEEFEAKVLMGKLPVIVTNHQSIADGIALGLVTRMISKPVRLPIAASIEEGIQGKVVKTIVKGYGPELKKMNLSMVRVVTKKDKDVRGMGGLNKEMFELLLKSPKEGFGLAIFPEQTVEGGRRGEDGKIKGMQYLETDRSAVAFLKKWIKQGFTPVVLPVGIDGGNLTFDPDDNTIPTNILEMVLDYKPVSAVATVTVGAPVEVREVDSHLTDHHFMKMIAQLVSPEARGAYASGNIRIPSAE